MNLAARTRPASGPARPVKRTVLGTLAAGAAVTLAATLALPTAAQAATASAAGVPAPQHSLYVAGYKQAGCNPAHNGDPIYTEILGNVVVPAATDLNGPPGESNDEINMGGLSGGVTAGVFVGSDAGVAYYHAFWLWEGSGMSGTAPYVVSPGDVLELTVEYEGSSGWLIDIKDATTDQDYSTTIVGPPVPGDNCQVGAYEQSPYPQPAVTTATSAIKFYDVRLRYSEAAGYQMSNLVGTPPVGATLHRYDLYTTSGTEVAATGKPAYHANFTITDK
jgi:hypothetical protein